MAGFRTMDVMSMERKQKERERRCAEKAAKQAEERAKQADERAKRELEPGKQEHHASMAQTAHATQLTALTEGERGNLHDTRLEGVLGQADGPGLLQTAHAKEPPQHNAAFTAIETQSSNTWFEDYLGQGPADRPGDPYAGPPGFDPTELGDYFWDSFVEVSEAANAGQPGWPDLSLDRPLENNQGLLPWFRQRENC